VSEPEPPVPGGAVSAVVTHTGRPAWQVNGHAAVRSLSRDPRLSDVDPNLPSRRLGEHDSAQTRDRREQEDSLGWSRVLRKAFSAERIEGLRPGIAAFVDGLLDELAAGHRPPDLHSQLSVPVVTYVTCSLLDVPFEDGARFRGWWDAVKTGDRAAANAGQAAMVRYVRELMRSRRGDGDGFVSTLLSSDGMSPSYPDRAVKFLTSLVSKGRETPTNALDWTFVLLLRDPSGYDAVAGDPELVDQTVEEVLRLFPVISGKIQGPEGIRRFALTDFRQDTEDLRRGDLVLLNVVGANMYTGVFPAPEEFHLGRSPNPHLTFGYGPHSCPAARLARIELQVALGALVRRFPTLRLAVDTGDLRYKERPTSEGFEELPVTW